MNELKIYVISFLYSNANMFQKLEKLQILYLVLWGKRIISELNEMKKDLQCPDFQLIHWWHSVQDDQFSLNEYMDNVLSSILCNSIIREISWVSNVFKEFNLFRKKCSPSKIILLRLQRHYWWKVHVNKLTSSRYYGWWIVNRLVDYSARD